MPSAAEVIHCTKSDRACPLLSLPLFAQVPADRWRRFIELATVREYQRGNILFYQGNPALGLYFICSGRVKVRKEGRFGHDQIVRIAEAPDLLGDRAFFSQSPYAATGEVMEQSTICFLEAKSFWDILGQENATLRHLVRRFAQELGHAEELMHCLAACTVRARAAAELLRSHDVEKKDEFLLTESRIELAQILGTTPEAVSRALAEFSDKGLIAVKGRKVRILDEEQLRRAACPHRRPPRSLA